MAIVEMIVNMDCHGCEKKVRRALKNLDGVDGIEIDMDLQKVTVTGYADQEKVLKVVRKTGRTADLWPFGYNSECFAFTQQYGDLYTYDSNPMTGLQDEQPDTTYMHHVHDYSGHENHTHQELRYTTIHGKTALVAFSDENVNACSIM